MNKLRPELLFTGQLCGLDLTNVGEGMGLGRGDRVYGIVRFLCRFR